MDPAKAVAIREQLRVALNEYDTDVVMQNIDFLTKIFRKLDQALTAKQATILVKFNPADPRVSRSTFDNRVDEALGAGWKTLCAGLNDGFLWAIMIKLPQEAQA
jgi:hypothetical protein